MAIVVHLMKIRLRWSCVASSCCFMVLVNRSDVGMLADFQVECPHAAPGKHPASGPPAAEPAAKRQKKEEEDYTDVLQVWQSFYYPYCPCWAVLIQHSAPYDLHIAC